MDGKDYTLQIRVKNGPLLRAMRAAGLSSAALARATGLNAQIISNFLCLRAAPQSKDGIWNKHVLKLSEFLHCLPEDLFPPQHIKEPLVKSTAEFECSIEEVGQFIGSYEMPEIVDKRVILDGVLGTLTPREDTILRLRFGMDEEEPLSLAECSERIGRSIERIRQIEQNALRKLRRPEQAAILRDLIEPTSGVPAKSNHVGNAPVRYGR